MLKVSLSLEGKGYLHFSDPSLLHRPPPTPDDANASRIQNIIHKTPTQLPTYNNASRTRRTPPTPDDASRMQYRHKTCATSPGPGPIVYIEILLQKQMQKVIILYRELVEH